MRVASYLTLGAGPHGEGFTRSVPRATPWASDGHHLSLQTGKQALRGVATCPQLHSSWLRGWGLNPGSDLHSHYSARSCSRTFDGSPVPMKCSTHSLRGPYGLVSFGHLTSAPPATPAAFSVLTKMPHGHPPHPSLRVIHF